MEGLLEPLPLKFRKRVPKACDHCRKRKIKCGAVNTATGLCDNCTKFNVACTFKHHDELERHRQNSEMERLRVGSGVKKPHTKTNDSGSGYEAQVIESTASTGLQSKSLLLERKLESLETQLASLIAMMSSQPQQQTAQKRDSELQQRKQELQPYFSGRMHTPDVSPRPKQKRYTTSLLTKRRIAWLRKKARSCCGHDNNANDRARTEVDMPAPMTFSPLMDVFVTSSKWYVAEVKKIIDFSNPFVPLHSPQMYPLPPQHEIMDGLKAYNTQIFTGGYTIVRGSELLNLFEKHFAGEKLSYSELLLLDISVCISTAYDFTSTDDYFLKEGTAELLTRESHMLLNSMYQYHKVSLLSEGFRSVQALLLLYQYVHSKVSADVAYNIFCVAQRYAQDIGLHKRETYHGLNFQDACQRLKIWFLCVSIDAQLSLAFGRPQLINFAEIDLFTQEFYTDFIKTHQLLPQTEFVSDSVGETNSVDQSMSIFLNGPDTVLIAASHYGMELNRISTRIYKSLLASDAMAEGTFDQVLERAVNLINDLKEWETSLPAALSLNNYEEHIRSLKNSSNEQLSKVNIELLSTSVLYIHFERLYLLILVCHMVCAFVVDNEEIHSQSRYNTVLIKSNLLKDMRAAGMQVIMLWPRVKCVPHMLHRLFYVFSVGAYILLFTSIGFAHQEESAEYISALCTTYEYLLQAGDIKVLKDNIKWNVSMFIYTFLLTLAIKCFQSCNPLEAKYKFDDTALTEKLGYWMTRCELNKNIAVDQLREHINIFAPSVDLVTEGSEGCMIPPGSTGADVELPRVLHLFSEIDVNDLNCLLSSLPIQITSFDKMCGGLQSVESNPTPATFAQPSPGVDVNLVPGLEQNFSMDFGPGDETQELVPPELGDQSEFEQILDNMVFERDFIFPAMM
ncbi:LANO_0A05666g1_1 [Lachancea nothofagi CBS 11611]|uniref:LANO_0A05666g1_1 n=1 Tax=Lachancea nothofagi CBS 11611 TaxID=1266666 RepID=A0A1G4IRQ0_9SACH|nr:LANO_0A05666g1_1 [Lachancea nothofagi CBS 11611]